jgi:hypothetical protein
LFRLLRPMPFDAQAAVQAERRREHELLADDQRARGRRSDGRILGCT